MRSVINFKTLTVALIALAACSGSGSSGYAPQPTLSLAVAPATIRADGTTVDITARATAADGTVGTGLVTFYGSWRHSE